ncbi:ABC transporter substrate-binding protein [Bordetella sp. 02P26C-1]|uniref:ABC transporter substrate-binding protein n=1 Tax=Bordetella sp. 02P26C-1 TaxID=2683195 RepID=UPI001352654F|nr:ABC transporter substrate-binding protein [Bordetella sp. 02P26C-1]MVW79830.1 ABC transporter [Bordetella sp. 02P26C-1]
MTLLSLRSPLLRTVRAAQWLGVVALCGFAHSAAAAPASDIPDTVPPGTVLRVGDPKTQRALELSGELAKLPFKVEWANISGGPRTTEAFRSRALDLGAVADIPPIHATWTGLPVKIVAAGFRKDPIDHPIYKLGIAPGAAIDSIDDLRGKKIAYSPGQAQGALVLRVLQKAGLTQKDVTLVEMPSTGDVYVSALASRLVDAAPIAEANQPRYLLNYGKDGAKLISHGLRDDPWYIYGLQSVLDDPAKAAAVREYVKAWARASRWIYEHPQEWIAGYFVEQQGLSADDGKHLVKSAGEPDIPADWNDAIARQQATIDLLAAETGKPRLRAEDLFDRRYENVAAQALETP